jgi:hypothetical protein
MSAGNTPAGEFDHLAPQVIDQSVLKNVTIRPREKRIEINFRNNGIQTITPKIDISESGITPEFRIEKGYIIQISNRKELYAEDLLEDFIKNVDTENKESYNAWLDKVLEWRNNREI